MMKLKAAPNEINIEPLSQKTIYQRRGAWVETKSAWLAIGGKLGKQFGKNPDGPQIYSVDCGYRFCIDHYLKEFETASISSFAKTQDEAYFKALAFALNEFQERVGCEYLDDLHHWKLAIVSSNEEFLDEIEAQIETPPDERSYFYGVSNRDPIELLTKFEKVEIVLISAEQAELIKEDRNSFY